MKFVEIYDISRDYGHNNIVSHYYDKDAPIPIWAIFELISLGEFGDFLSCLHENVRLKISSSVSVDSDGIILQKIIYWLKDLRNVVAHNNTIFDTLFQ